MHVAGSLYLVRIIYTYGEIDLKFADKGLYYGAFFVGIDAYKRDGAIYVCCAEAVKFGHLRLAWAAPGGEEIEDDNLFAHML